MVKILYSDSPEKGWMTVTDPNYIITRDCIIKIGRKYLKVVMGEKKTKYKTA